MRTRRLVHLNQLATDPNMRPRLEAALASGVVGHVSHTTFHTWDHDRYVWKHRRHTRKPRRSEMARIARRARAEGW